MSRFKIINVFDKIFVSICVFLITYAWLNFFARNLWFSFIVSLVLSAAILFILFYLLEKKQTKKANTKNKTEEIEKTFLLFKTMPINDKLTYIKDTISSNGDAEIFNESILIKREQNTQQIFIATNEKLLSEQTLFNIIEKRHNDTKQIIIICENLSPNLTVEILKNLTIEMVDKTKFFHSYVSTSNTHLDISTLCSKPKKTARQILSNLFVPIKAKQYFFCGLILIFSSLILPYKTYYLIFGSLLLLFTILCKLQPLISNRFKSKN